MKKHAAILFSCALAFAMLFSLTHVTPVKAVPPIPYYIDWGSGLDMIDCGTFQISWSWSAYEDGITHLDQEGHMVRSNVTVHWADHYYREGTDLEAFNNSNWTGGYTWDDEGNMVTAFGHGKIVLVHVPGYGPILRETGYIYLNYVTGEWIDHGNNREYTDGELTELCGYFSGE